MGERSELAKETLELIKRSIAARDEFQRRQKEALAKHIRPTKDSDPKQDG